MKIKVQAQHLRKGDIVGSGEKIIDVWIGIRTPTGKVNIVTDRRQAIWGKYTMINIDREEIVASHH